MVLYMTMVKGGKPEKTNWVMHQYHLGTEEDVKDGEYVICKIFLQQQQTKQGDKADLPEMTDTMIVKVDPVTPKSVTPGPPRTGRHCHEYNQRQEYTITCVNPSPQVFSPKHPTMQYVEDEVQTECESSSHNDLPDPENHLNQMLDNNNNNNNNNNDYHHAEEDPKWWDGESQYLLDSQQLVEGLSLCDKLLQGQSPNRDANGNDGALESKPRLSDYAQLRAEHLKKDLEECQNLEGDPTNIELDTSPEFRLSQLEFGSQDSFIAWGGIKVID
ncbi:hypothetical protein CRYUN_Cryun29cG0108100 [Craigia yunnanensis]